MSLSTSPLSESDWAMAPKTPPMEPSELPLLPPLPLPLLRTSSPVIRSIDEVPIIPAKSPTCAVKNSPIRHSKYYIDEQMAIFLVDNHLYKVHRHFLRQESLKFDVMLDHLPPDQSGETDENPIVLPEVTQGEFEALLEYFYAGLYFKVAENRPRPLQEYIDLLSIATRYECTDARTKAIDGIESLGPNAVQRIVLAEKFDVPSWLKPAYIELCEREKPLELPEGEQLGLQKVILIARAREKIRADVRVPSPANCPIPQPFDYLSSHPVPQVPVALPVSPIANSFLGLVHGNNPAPLPPALDFRVNRIVNEIFFPVSPSLPEPETPTTQLEPCSPPPPAVSNFGSIIGASSLLSDKNGQPEEGEKLNRPATPPTMKGWGGMKKKSVGRRT